MNNPTIWEVTARYKNGHTGKVYRRQQEVDALPGMREIKDRKKKILQIHFRNAINGTEDDKLENELAEIQKKEAGLLRSVPAKYDCALCRDTGYINGKYCRCLRDLIYREVYGAADIAGLPEGFGQSDKSKFSTTYQCANGRSQQAKYAALEKHASKYAQDFPNTQKFNLLLSGPTGLGKTFILRSIAKSVHQNGGDAMLIGASDLFSVFHRHRLGYDVDLELLWLCDLLLIDDLGVEPTTQNVTVEYFLDLLNKRIDHKKHTVVATNLSMENLIARYGERVYSRIRFKDICDQLVFEGMDIRLK